MEGHEMPEDLQSRPSEKAYPSVPGLHSRQMLHWSTQLQRNSKVSVESERRKKKWWEKRGEEGEAQPCHQKELCQEK